MVLKAAAPNMHLDMDLKRSFQPTQVSQVDGLQHVQHSVQRPRPRAKVAVPRPLCYNCAGQPGHNNNQHQVSNEGNLLSFDEQFQLPHGVSTEQLIPHRPLTSCRESQIYDVPIKGATTVTANNEQQDFVSWNIPPVGNVNNLGSPVSHWSESDTDYFAALANYPKTDFGQAVTSKTIAPNYANQQQHQHNHLHQQQQQQLSASVRPVQSVQPLIVTDRSSHLNANGLQVAVAAVVAQPRESAITTAPSSAINVPEPVHNYTNKEDLVRLVRTYDQLAKCCFYYPKLTMPEAKKKLSRSGVGVFLLRDSSDPRFLFSLSIRTRRGTTSIRISYCEGRFLLDCEDKAKEHMPSADCVIKLVQMYVGQTASSAANTCVFLESNGRRDTPVQMTKPCFDSPLSLKHMARKSLNSTMLQKPAFAAHLAHKLPLDVRGYMNEYKYCI